MTETDSRYDDLTADEQAELLELGASSEFLTLATHDDGGRNSVRENANRALDFGVDSEGNPNFGHFGTYMWEGNLYKAFERADARNINLMLEVFGMERINADAKARGEVGYAKEPDTGRWVYADSPSVTEAEAE